MGIIAGLVITATGIYWLGDEKGWWERFREGDRIDHPTRLIASPALFLLLLVFLTLPWMTIKCEDENFVTVSGLDMILLEETIVSTPGGRDTLSPEITDTALVYVAIVIALVGAALLFVPMHRDKKRYTRAGLAGLGVLALVGFWLQMMMRVDSESEGLARVSMEYGFYLGVLAFLAALAIQFIPLSVPPAEAPDPRPTNDC